MAVWKFIVRPIAVRGMLVGAATTLFAVRRSLGAGLKRAVRNLTSARVRRGVLTATSTCSAGWPCCLMIAVYFWFTGAVGVAITAAVMIWGYLSRPSPATSSG